MRCNLFYLKIEHIVMMSRCHIAVKTNKKMTDVVNVVTDSTLNKMPRRIS